jgi:NAD(P)-dependent dehydrogenase (short-subunit alcohol dehydrogenase family)
MTENVLITGANGGLGHLTTVRLLEAGHSVVATMRDIETRNLAAANELRAAGAHVVELDVTDEASVDAAVAGAIELVGHLDVVINNAGVGSTGLLETFTPADWLALFDINVFGVQRVTRAALPSMRRQGSGLLVVVSSVVGRMAVPFFGPYNAAKFAVEGLAETYRSELSTLGIETCIIEPGAYPTNFIDGLMESSDRSRDATYGDMVHLPKGLVESFEGAMASNPAQNPQNVADAIVALIDTPAGERRFRTVVDSLGMGDAVTPFNDAGDQMTGAIYGAFGIGNLLELKTGAG